jgi:hypothetical protein
MESMYISFVRKKLMENYFRQVELDDVGRFKNSFNLADIQTTLNTNLNGLSAFSPFPLIEILLTTDSTATYDFEVIRDRIFAKVSCLPNKYFRKTFFTADGVYSDRSHSFFHSEKLIASLSESINEVKAYTKVIKCEVH